MAKYQKKPVVIEAIQMTAENRASNANWPEWLNAAWNKERDEVGSLRPVLAFDGGPTEFFVQTLEGSMRVDQDDWIIRGVQGELCPCKPDIFAMTYDAYEEVVMPGLFAGDLSEAALNTLKAGEDAIFGMAIAGGQQPLTTDQFAIGNVSGLPVITDDAFKALYLNDIGAEQKPVDEQPERALSDPELQKADVPTKGSAE